MLTTRNLQRKREEGESKMNEKIIQSDGLELEAAMSTNDFLMNFCPNFVL